MISEFSGILMGLGAAVGQSISYFFSRWFVLKRHRGVLRLLVLAHLLMGAAALALLPLVWPKNMPPIQGYIWPLLGSAGFYLLGQIGLFVALHYTDASRTAPLLGLKVIILAGITAIFLGGHLTPLQWLAVLIAVAAAFVMNATGGRLPWPALAAIVGACLAYSLSDICIQQLVRSLESGEGLLRATLLGVFMTYPICGLVALPLLRWTGRGAVRDWPYAVPFAASWLTAMVCLFACFATIGALYGNIVQSSRGLITVILGACVATMGSGLIEQKVSHGVWLRRAAAATLMARAIILYSLGRP